MKAIVDVPAKGKLGCLATCPHEPHWVIEHDRGDSILRWKSCDKDLWAVLPQNGSPATVRRLKEPLCRGCEVCKPTKRSK